MRTVTPAEQAEKPSVASTIPVARRCFRSRSETVRGWYVRSWGEAAGVGVGDALGEGVGESLAVGDGDDDCVGEGVGLADGEGAEVGPVPGHDIVV
jgi:hypothetical protein